MGDPQNLRRSLMGLKVVPRNPQALSWMWANAFFLPSHQWGSVISTNNFKGIILPIDQSPILGGRDSLWHCKLNLQCVCAHWLTTKEPQPALCLSVKSSWILWYHQRTTAWPQSLNSTNSHMVLPQRGGWAGRAHILQPLLRPQQAWKHCLNSPQHLHYEHFCPRHLCQNKRWFGLGAFGLFVFVAGVGKTNAGSFFFNSKKCG